MLQGRYRHDAAWLAAPGRLSIMNDLLLGALLGFGAGVLVTGGGFYLWFRRRPDGATPVQPAPLAVDDRAGTPLLDQLLNQDDPRETLRQNLRVKFLYDEKKVDHAIDYERERSPQASEEELMRAAIERWERENR
jgi:hypothetical protein